MNEAIHAYQDGNLRPSGSVEVHQITAESEFRERQRLWEDARHNEAAALRHARDEEREENRQFFLQLLNQGLTIDEIKLRLSSPVETP